jgi:hypothetical protein
MKKLNDRNRCVFQILSFCLFFGGNAFLVAGQTNKPALIYDGRTEARGLRATAAEERLVEREVRKKETAIKEKSNQDCVDDTFSVGAVARGSFTKPKAAQSVVLYELCRSGRSFGIGGIVIVENGKIVAHYTYGENGLDYDLVSLPDINQNGLSEIVLIGGGGGQGYSANAVEIIEMTAGGVKSFGIADTYKDDFGTGKPNSSATGYKVTVQPGKNPIYFRETYRRKTQSGKWSLIKKAQRFPLRKDYVPKYNKIL